MPVARNISGANCLIRIVMRRKADSNGGRVSQDSDASFICREGRRDLRVRPGHVLAREWAVKIISVDGKLLKTHAGEVAERLKAAVC
jgi:tRNA U34 2-thiouridine synthase MnmA/TrmU